MNASSLFDLSDRVALVTGASRGLGRQMALALARAGAHVGLTSRTRASLEGTVAEVASVGRRAFAVEMEARSVESIRAAVAATEAHFGRIDILINNAGCNVRKASLEVTEEDWATVVDTNLRGPFFAAQAAARGMVARGWGRIVNIGSVTSVAGYAGIGPYCASRGGIKQLTMSLADEWGPHGVTVNCLAPGWFKTAQNAVLYEDAAWLAGLCDRIPLRRPGSPPDLDGTVVFLASEASAYVTGQTILVDGGITVNSVRAVPRAPTVTADRPPQ